MGAIYGLYDPRTQELRYVGLTGNLDLRLQRHLRRARKRKCNFHVYNWIRQLLAEGLEPELDVLQDGIHLQDLPRAEESWIEWARQEGYPLTNMTEGGDGRGGNKHHPPECRCHWCMGIGPGTAYHRSDCGCAFCRPGSHNHRDNCRCPWCSSDTRHHPSGCRCPWCTGSGGPRINVLPFHPDSCGCPFCTKSGGAKFHRDGCGCPFCRPRPLTKDQKEKLRESGKAAAHQYWHVRRNKPSPRCAHCAEENLVRSAP